MLGVYHITIHSHTIQSHDEATVVRHTERSLSSIVKFLTHYMARILLRHDTAWTPYTNVVYGQLYMTYQNNNHNTCLISLLVE